MNTDRDVPTSMPFAAKKTVCLAGRCLVGTAPITLASPPTLTKFMGSNAKDRPGNQTWTVIDL